MGKHHVFRPRLSEILEARAVPSMAGVSVATGIPGISVTLPRQVSPDSPQVQAAFTAFDRSYVRAVDTILLAPGTDGLIVPSRNQAAFVEAVDRSLTALAEQLVLSLAATSGGSTEANQVVDAITGPGQSSLESQLLALSLAEIQSQVANTPGLANVTTQALVPNVVTTAEQVRPTTRVPVAESTAPASTGSGSTSSTSSGAADDVRSAFGNFLSDYFKAVQGVLLAPGPDGRVDPKANRADFDATIGQAIRSLESHLATTLGRDPATSGLGPQVRSAIEGDGASSLKARLASLATPGGPQASTVRDFTLGSTRAIAQALSLISGDVSNLLGRAGR